jgi:hypothetical protein
MPEEPVSRPTGPVPERRRAVLLAAEFQHLQERARKIGEDIAGIGEIESEIRGGDDPAHQTPPA